MKKWTIIISATTKKAFTINSGILILGLCFIVILILLSVFNYYRIIDLVIKRKEILSEKNKTENLSYKLEILKTEIFSLHEKLNTIVELDKKERLVWGLSSIDDDVRKLGIGGISNRTEIENALLKINNTINFELSSFKEIFKDINKKIEIINRTPSIWPADGQFVSGFGWRYTRSGKDFHNGIDIANKIGTKIKAAADGIVSFVGWKGGLGLTVEIDHGYDCRTLYGHLHRTFVSVGDKVKRGDFIAEMGNTGVSSGPHLHYEVKIGDKALNPIKYIIPDAF